MSNHPRDPSGPLFFVHVMKTGGSTLRVRMKRQFGPDAVYPTRGLDPEDSLPNLSVSYLGGLTPERLAKVRGISGHFPFFATELVPPPSHVLTILRDPVERTISYLKQHHRDRGLGANRSLESIYDRPLINQLHIQNYQVRVFASTVLDNVDTVMTPLEIDDRRMETAKEHLHQVDLLGLHDRYDEFVALVQRSLGWSNHRVVAQRVSEPVEVPSALRRRIAADNEADIQFYAFARDLYARRMRSTV